jgi:hypothetical protein
MPMPYWLPPCVTGKPKLGLTFGSEVCPSTTQVMSVQLARASLNSESITAKAIGFISSRKARQLSSFLLVTVIARNRQIFDWPKTLLAISRRL